MNKTQTTNNVSTTAPERPVFVRRCHCCGEVMEAEVDILKCTSCKRSLLPFYYFDKRRVKEFADNQVRPDDEIVGDKQYGPIRGLTAYW